MTCKYTLTDANGQEITLTGQSELKSYLVDGGLSHLYPDGNFPWVENIDGGKNENNQINRKESKSAQARNIKDSDALDTQTSKESQAQALSDTAQKRLSKDIVQNGNEAYKSNQLQEQQNVGESGLVAKRGKPKNTIIFTTPISNKYGDKIVSYSWAWREGEKFDEHDGGLVNARVSDWDSAITNPDTGRDIVHKFNIELANGETKTVSLESAEKILGIKNLLTQVKGRMNRSWLRNINSLMKSVLNEYRPKDINGKPRWDKQNPNFNKVYDAYMDLSELVGDKKADERSLQNKEEYATSDRAISILLTKKGKQIDDLVNHLSNATGININSEETEHNLSSKESEQQAEPVVDATEPDAETKTTTVDPANGEHEKMPENTFMDKSLPVTTGVNTRMVVIDKPLSSEATDSDDLKYSKPVSVTKPYNKDSLTKALEKELDAEYGQGWFNRLLATDKFKVINRDEATQYSDNAVDAQGFYHPELDTTFFVADNISKDDDLKGLMLHEIGTHQLTLNRNDAEFQSILKQLDALKDKNAKVKAAYERIPKDTKAEHRLEELAAYIVQNEPSLSISKRIIAWFKNALRNIAKYVKGADRAALIKWANSIDENDVIYMTNAALKSAPDTLVFSNERAKDDIKYSKPADTEDNALWPDEPKTENEWIDAVKTKLENLTDRAKVAAYGAFTVRQLSTLGKNIMPQLKGFSSLLQKRESLQNRYKNESGRLVDNHWKKLDSKNAYRINTVINESTLYDIDSSREWTGIEKQGDVYVAYTQNVYSGPDQEKIVKRAASLGGKLVGKTKAEFTSQKQAAIFISALRDYKPTLSDQERQKQHKLNYARFQSLPKDAQYIYRDAYRQHDDLFNAKMAALEKRISKAIFDEKKRSQFIATVRQQFESNRMNWYYAPLSRFGDYWLYGKVDGQPYFETFESESALNRAKESFQGDLIGSGRKIEDMKDNEFDSVGEGFIANIQSMLQEAEAPEELQDQVYQMFLETLPTVSMRKNSIHRQGIAGFDKDAMRAFSNSLWHGSKQLSNLMYNNEMSRLLSDAKKAIDVASSRSQVKQIENEIEAAQKLLDDWANYPLVALKVDLDNDPSDKVIESMISLRKKYETLDEKDRVKRLKSIIKKHNDLIESADKIRSQDNGPIQASKLVSEMNKAFEDMQKSDYSPLVQTAMQFNFVTMLGLSPAFFLVNTIQTPAVAMPRAFGRFGNLPKVMKIYGDSLADFMDAVVNRRKDEYGNWSLTATLKDKLAKAEQKGDTEAATIIRQEIFAMNKFLKDGDVDKTQGYDLIGVAEEGAAHGGIMLKVAQTSGFLAHHSERMNREITLLSNFRLAREKGEGIRDAINTARELNIDSHLDYSSENTARFMRSPSMKLLTQFMKYKQGMYFLWFRSIHEAFKGKSEADQKEGMRTAIGLVTMQTALAGTMGLPLMGALMTTLDLIGGMFDDDDDKWDTKKEIRLGLHKVLSPLGEVGDKLAESITMGVVNGFTPVELHSRLDLSDVIFRDPIKEMEGRDAGAYMVASLFGPTGGNVIDMYESVRLANDGLWARAVETFPFMPKFGADFLKAIRFGTEDARTQNDKLLKEMSKPEVILQALGLSSSNLSRKYDENSYTKNAERDITEARNKIIEKIAEGRIKGDLQLVAEGQREAQEWRTKHPEYPITAKSIKASIRARRRAEKNMKGSGIRVNPRLDYLRDENKIEG